ncbi:hypothetical protein CIB84_010803 [Bambusicola thoracicus]|uniref:Uncharacterized protein n=1 Tax=Bambusicola thoracicus TaxID=9083 RepID=A0A2P4SMX3_BAMTH|nr:hypothetical protein CIB84_010803 [Bambusicola thoracicus]
MYMCLYQILGSQLTGQK